jgi:RND family efflux transporter MFP subunit
VTVTTVATRVIQEWDEYTGRLRAVETVEIRPRVSGYIQSVNFTDGQMVKQGDLLFVIDPRPYQAVLDAARAELARTEASLALAVNDMERAEKLLANRAISAEEYDSRSKQVQQAEAAVQAARANVAAAELDVEFTQVRSPIDGRMSRSLVDIGNLISGGTEGSTPLATVVSLDPIHAYFTASEQEYLRYTRLASSGNRPSSRDTANPVEMRLIDEEGFPHRGVMDYVDNQIDPSTGTMQGRAIFDNPDHELIPGLFVTVRLLGAGAYEAVLAPDQAIGKDQSTTFVVVVDDSGVARYRSVTLGPIIDGLRVIRSGLSAGERIVIEGLQRVRSGSPVTPDHVELDAWLSRFDAPPQDADGADE